MWKLGLFFFRSQVDDQMKLLQHAWSDLLILDHLHQRLHNHLPDESSLPNGQKFNLLLLSLLGCPNLEEPLHDLTARLTEIRFDVPDYVCLKFLMLLNPGNGIISYFIFLFFSVAQRCSWSSSLADPKVFWVSVKRRCRSIRFGSLVKFSNWKKIKLSRRRQRINEPTPRLRCARSSTAGPLRLHAELLLSRARK